MKKKQGIQHKSWLWILDILGLSLVFAYVSEMTIYIYFIKMLKGSK